MLNDSTLSSVNREHFTAACVCLSSPVSQKAHKETTHYECYSFRIQPWRQSEDHWRTGAVSHRVSSTFQWITDSAQKCKATQCKPISWLIRINPQTHMLTYLQCYHGYQNILAIRPLTRSLIKSLLWQFLISEDRFNGGLVLNSWWNHIPAGIKSCGYSHH